MESFFRLLSSVLFILILSIFKVHAATCSCAGVPLATNVNFDLKKDQWILEGRYTYTDISLLISGSDRINDETGRKRETESFILSASYGISDDWSIITMTSWVKHIRNIAISNQADEESSGIGDMMLIAGYSPFKITPFNAHQLGIGLGIRIPVGSDDNKNGEILFIEDMQPSQGASASSLWLQYQYAFNQKADLIFTLDTNYTDNRSNDRGYSFGSEWTVSPGLSWTMSERWQFSGALSWRVASRHSRNAATLPNTGGRWLDASLSASYNVSPSSAFSFSLREPVSRNLNDALQFSTKHSVVLGYSYAF